MGCARGFFQPDAWPAKLKDLYAALQSGLLALLRGAVERLAQAFQRVAVGRLRPLRGRSLDDKVAALAHGIDHARFLGGVLDPGAVVLRVHGEFAAADLDRRIAVRFEAVADDDRNLVAHIFGRAG